MSDPRASPLADPTWGGLTERRIIALVTLVLFLPIWIIGGAWGLVAGFLIAFLAIRAARLWPCPRCHAPFAGARWGLFPPTCASCGLPAFSDARQIERVAYEAPAPGSTLRRGTRRFIAISEGLGGVLAMALVAFWGDKAPWWYTILLEGLGGLSLAAAVWLWRDEARGYALSRIIQVVQLVRVQSPWLVYVASAGFVLDLKFGHGQMLIAPGLNGSLLLSVGTGAPLWTSVNLLAATLLLFLLGARPGEEATRARDAVPTAPMIADVATELAGEGEGHGG